MNNEELKKKIESIIRNAKRDFAYCVPEEWAVKVLADALIAAGIGDVKRHRVFVSKDGKEVKQFYSGEEVENILKERKELKDELRSKVEYIHEQDEVIKEYKHRAARAERALFLSAKEIEYLNGDFDSSADFFAKEKVIPYFMKKAEKELAEERKE